MKSNEPIISFVNIIYGRQIARTIQKRWWIVMTEISRRIHYYLYRRFLLVWIKYNIVNRASSAFSELIRSSISLEFGSNSGADKRKLREYPPPTSLIPRRVFVRDGCINIKRFTDIFHESHTTQYYIHNYYAAEPFAVHLPASPIYLCNAG